MSRSVEEWRGKTDDSAVPRKVRDRVFLAHGGRCHLSGRKIFPGDAWDLDHIVPLKDGGPHSESNLAPAIKSKHIEKTSAENTQRAKEERQRAKHFGYWPKSKSKLQGQGFRSSRVVPRTEKEESR